MTKQCDFIAALRSDIVRELVSATGAPETHVMPVASKIIEALHRRWAGEQVYVASVPRYDAEAVMADFNYRNHAEVCAKHRISRATLLRVVRRHSKKPASAFP